MWCFIPKTILSSKTQDQTPTIKKHQDRGNKTSTYSYQNYFINTDHNNSSFTLISTQISHHNIHNWLHYAHCISVAISPQLQEPLHLYNNAKELSVLLKLKQFKPLFFQTKLPYAFQRGSFWLWCNPPPNRLLFTYRLEGQKPMWKKQVVRLKYFGSRGHKDCS